MPHYLDSLKIVTNKEQYDFIRYEGEEIQYLKCENKNDMWAGYCSKTRAGKAGALLETIPDYSSFAVYFYAKDESGESIDSERFAEQVASVLQNVSHDLLVESKAKEYFIVVVLETPGTASNEVSFRFQMPYVYLNHEGKKEFYKRFSVLARESKLTNMLPRNARGDIEDMFKMYFDEMPLVGSCAKLDSELTRDKPMFFKYIYFRDTSDNGEVDLATPVMDYDLMMIGAYHKDGDEINLDDFEEYSIWLPMFLSTKFKPDTSKFKLNKVKITVEDNPAELCKKFLSLISLDRYPNEMMCQYIGRAIHSVYDGNSEGAHVWLHEIKRAQIRGNLPYIKTTPGDYVKDIYENLGKQNITVATLAFYAFQDNPVGYKAWSREWVDNALEKIVEISDNQTPTGVWKIPHTRTAIALYRFYWLFYKCVDISKRTWYIFDGVRWVPDDSGITLSRNMSTVFRTAVLEMSANLVQERLKAVTDKAFQIKATQLINRYENLALALEDSSFKSRIMREAAEWFYDKNLLKVLDTNYSVLGTEDKVIEINGPEIYVRDGKPEDFISKSLPVKLDMNYNWEHKKVLEVMEWLRKVFCHDEEYLKYFLKYKASCLYGRNLERKFVNLTGKGGNSKSVTVQLDEATFGTYLIKIPVSALTGKRGTSSNASPEFARIEGARIIVIDEPDESERLNKAMLKILASNGDSMFARFLNQNGKDVRMNAHPMLVCNDPPDCPNADGATRDRWETFFFGARWSDEAPDDPIEQIRQNHYKKDLDFPDHVPNLAAAYLWILVQYWTIYKKETLSKKPDIVVNYTKAYWEKHDTYLKFTKQRIQIATDKKGRKDENAKLHLEEVYNVFTSWYRRVYGNRNEIPDQTIFLNRISEHWGAPIDEVWSGIEFKELKTTKATPLKTPGLRRNVTASG